MNKSMISTTLTGFPVVSILGLIFITLKLAGHISWSWWWVLAPFWGPFAIAAACFLLAAACVALVTIVATVCVKRRVRR